MPDNQQQQIQQAAGALSNLTRATQQFIADVLTEKPDKLYRLDDYGTIRSIIFDNVKDAVTKRFPLRNNRYTLSVEDVDYDDPEDVSLDEQKRMLLEGKSSARRLRGSWVLRDATNDKEISRTRRMTIMRVPRISDRGTFIRNGKEFCIGNIMRLEPGVYTRKSPDAIGAQFNIKQGTGSGFHMRLNPESGLFTFRRGSTNVSAYAVLHDLGVTDEEMKETWGQDIFNKNKQAGISDKAKSMADKIYNM